MRASRLGAGFAPGRENNAPAANAGDAGRCKPPDAVKNRALARWCVELRWPVLDSGTRLKSLQALARHDRLQAASRWGRAKVGTRYFGKS